MYFKFSNVINDINNILLPKVCFGCGVPLSVGERLLCTVCRYQIPLTEYDFTDENQTDKIFYGRVDIKKANSFLFYTENGIVKNLIHYLKYKNQEEIGVFLGDWFGQIISESNSLPCIDMIIPVPLHKKKLKKRGYNQLSRFGEQLALHLNTKLEPNILIKTANTKTQTKKSRTYRWHNTQSLYILKGKTNIKDKTILLIDDVVTTGATLEACAITLKQIEGVTIYIATMTIVSQH